jgi:hypothetical protein
MPRHIIIPEEVKNNLKTIAGEGMVDIISGLKSPTKVMMTAYVLAHASHNPLIPEKVDALYKTLKWIASRSETKLPTGNEKYYCVAKKFDISEQR